MKNSKFELQLDRHEAKYILPRTLLPQLREFIRPFCEPDPHCVGSPPEYTIVTLQLDTMDYALHLAKEKEALNRFKLRVRTYGNPAGLAPVFLEIKRKFRRTIVKSRTMIPYDQWNESVITNPLVSLKFKSRKEEDGFIEFLRLVKLLDARPKILIRYIRESYFGKNEHYARVTFDRKLEYQPTDSWTGFGNGGHWYPADAATFQNRMIPYSGIVLELKTLSDAPQWMIDLVMNFGLERTGHCKYSNAVLLESLFRGYPAAPDQLAAVMNW